MSAMFLTRRLAHVAAPGERAPAQGGAALLVPEREGARPRQRQRERAPSCAAPSPRSSSGATRSTSTSWPPPWPKGPSSLRPARVRDVELGDFDHRVTVERGRRRRETVACRWVLDATGRANFLGKRLGLIERNEEHPTAAIWCRWKNVRHIDDLAARGPLSLLPRQRQLAPPGDEPLHRLRLLGLVHPAGQRRDQRRRRLRQAARRSGPGQEPGARLHGLPAGDSLAGRAARGRQHAAGGPAVLLATSPTSPGSTWATAGRSSATRRRSSIPTTRRGSTMPRSRVEATVEIVKAQTRGGGRRPPASPSTTRRSCARTGASSGRSTRTSTTTWASTTCSRASFLIDTAQYYIFVVIPAYRLSWEVPLDAGARARSRPSSAIT